MRSGLNLNTGNGKLLSLLVNICSTCLAGGMNCFMMRMKELEGVTIKDKWGKEVGKSKNAGQIVITSMVTSRAALSFCALGIPISLLMILSRLPFYNRVKVPVDLVAVTLGLCAGLPLSVSLFEANLKIPSDLLEKEFKHLEYAMVNKGL